MIRTSEPQRYRVEDLEVRHFGAGDPPVLLLHGWGGNSDTLNVLSQPISTHREVWSLSLPGFGSSPEPDAPWGTWDYVNLVKNWMDTTALPAFDIIAHSFGGRVAIALAAQHPALVRQMVLIGSAGMKPERMLKTQFKIASAKILRKTADLIGGRAAIKLRERYRKMGSSDWKAASEVMKGTLSRVLKEELSEECRAIKVPTLLIWGSEDRDTPLSAAHRMNSLIHESELFILPGAGHYCFLEKRGEVLSRIWQHLGLPNLW